jgi:putative transposase
MRVVGARLMCEAGLRIRSRKRRRLVSSSRHALPIVPNHLDRQFASDMAYVRAPKTGCIWRSCSISTRAVVGWAIHHRMQQVLVHAALEMAAARRQPKEDVLLH